MAWVAFKNVLMDPEFLEVRERLRAGEEERADLRSSIAHLKLERTRHDKRGSYKAMCPSDPSYTGSHMAHSQRVDATGTEPDTLDGQNPDGFTDEQLAEIKNGYDELDRGMSFSRARVMPVT